MLFGASETEKFLQNLSEFIDVPVERQEEAQRRYKSVGEWLSRPESRVSSFNPSVYVQGSFALGTAVRPDGQDDYDLDIVCEVEGSKKHTTQKDLKDVIGAELLGYTQAQNMNHDPEEKKRCWTLEYASGAQFHLDVLPAFPDAAGARLLLERYSAHQKRYTETAIAITDNTEAQYSNITDYWPSSNPAGYAAWFKERMQVQFELQKRRLAESMSASVEEVPEYRVRTPLQRVVQILKRHRDVTYDGPDDHKPISIIITTLAAQAYNNEASLEESIRAVVFEMVNHIQRDSEGNALILNPVNPAENFADKWVDRSKEYHFREWLQRLSQDFSDLLAYDNPLNAQELIEQMFGRRTFKKMTQENILLSENQKLSIFSPKDSVISVLHRNRPRWKMDIDQRVSVEVSGIFEKDGFRPTGIVSSDQRLQKGGKLKFSAKTNASGKPKYYWQVVNTGQQAADANALRGGFYSGNFGTRGQTLNEETSYTGRHWVECFVVKGRKCIARSGEFMVNIE